jgi:hypothetical protein
LGFASSSLLLELSDDEEVLPAKIVFGWVCCFKSSWSCALLVVWVSSTLAMVAMIADALALLA